MTHAEQLLIPLRRRWMTWGDLQALRISNSPWARLLCEGGTKHLRPGEKLARRTRKDGLIEMRVVKASM